MANVINSIKIGNTESVITTPYATCTTAAATAAKVATITPTTPFSLTKGARVTVAFTNGHTAGASLTLNVNSTGAKSIYLCGCDTTTVDTVWGAGETVEFVYDGTYWEILRGAMGPQGPQGKQGPTGARGVQGPTGAKGGTGAQGPTGATGPTGKQGPTGAASTVAGPKGPTGAQGKQGPTGAAGKNATTTATATPTGNGLMSSADKKKLDKIDACATRNIFYLSGTTNEQISSESLYFSNDGNVKVSSPCETVLEFNYTPTSAAITGALGYTPIQTIKTAAGTNINSVGTPAVTASASGSTTTLTFNYLKGAAGAKGPTGAQGKQGPTGAASTVAGPTGPTGKQGPTGAASTVAGPVGPTGATGKQGPTGAASTVAGPTGAQGKQGPTGAKSTVAGPTGAQGKQGPTGAASTVAGPTGPTGKQGPTGATGATGPTGSTGPTGPTGKQGPTGAASTVAGPTGPTGKQGPTGAQGVQGPTGAGGKNGTNGTRGSTWYTGTKLTGTSTTAAVKPTSGVASAVVGDMYLNTSTSYVYRCTVAGPTGTAKWVYSCSIKGATGATGPTGPTGPAGSGGGGSGGGNRNHYLMSCSTCYDCETLDLWEHDYLPAGSWPPAVGDMLYVQTAEGGDLAMCETLYLHYDGNVHAVVTTHEVGENEWAKFAAYEDMETCDIAFYQIYP